MLRRKERGDTRRAAAFVVVAATMGMFPWQASAVDASCWVPPVAAPIVDPFRAPSCPWCPGNRGIEFATAPGQLVTAVETGRVTFAGSIAGVSYVVVEHRDGRRITYGRLLQRRHEHGDVVVRGQVVGTADVGFHFGVRVGEQYVDPAPLLGRWAGRPRLVPVDGTEAPDVPPVLRCGIAPPTRRGAFHAAPR